MRKKLLITSSLAVLLGLGVAGGLSLAKKEAKAVKVDAATSSVTLAGTFNSWNTTANPMTKSGGYWTIEYSFTAGDEFKVVVNGSDWVGWGNGLSGDFGSHITSASGNGSNFKIVDGYKFLIKAVDGIDGYGDKSYGITINIVKEDPATTTNQFYVNDPHNILGSTFTNVKVYGYGQADNINAMDWPGTHSGITQTTLGWINPYQVSLSTSYPNFIMNNGTNQTVNIEDLSSHIGDVLVIDNEKDGSNYKVHWDSPDIYTDYPASDGYYLLGNAAFVNDVVGSGTEWKFSGSVKMETLSGEGNKASHVLVVSTTVIFRAKSYFDHAATWLDFGSDQTYGDGITKSGDNVQLAAGTYTIYVNSGTKVYVIKGIPLDAYCTTFLDETELVCKGDSTVRSELLAVMNEMESDWAQLSTADKATLTGATARESGTDAEKVAARYDYILGKYGYAAGTGNFHDFMGRTPASLTAPRISILGNITNGDSDTTLLLAVVASTLAILGVGGYFFLRRKKEQ